MPIDIVMGALWGDEGKGKISDYLAENADAVVRWSGGDNAGHKVVVKDKKYKFHLMPSGVVHKDVYAIVGNGCVINPEAFIEEINYLKKNNLHTNNIYISNRAHVIMPYHILLDAYEEETKKNKIGTTKKGIGPTYTDKVKRVGIRMADLIDDETFQEKLKINVDFYNKKFKNVYKKDEISYENIYKKYSLFANKLKPYVTDTSFMLEKLIRKNKKIVFEGAQGALLDIDHGTYPYVTSSNPIGSSAGAGAGIDIKEIKNIYGVTKAYCTRVGAGPMPTLIKGDLAKKIREIGNEYGSTTGRPRDIGWLDIVALNHSIRSSSITKLVLTLLDVLTGIKELKICTHYVDKNGKKTRVFPAIEKNFKLAKARYITMPGWDQDITKTTSFESLPKNAQNYINKIEELTGKKVSIFSVGPERNQTIFR